MVTILLRNLLGYDILILMLGLVAGLWVMPRANKASLALKKKLQPTLHLPIANLLGVFRGQERGALSLEEIKELKDEENRYVSLLGTIISVFPLLGILGTIISLLRMSGLGTDEVLVNFTTALTSTFWGLVLAIGFKGLSASLMFQSEQNSENFDLLILRLDNLKQGGDSHETV